MRQNMTFLWTGGINACYEVLRQIQEEACSFKAELIVCLILYQVTINPKYYYPSKIQYAGRIRVWPHTPRL